MIEKQVKTKIIRKKNVHKIYENKQFYINFNKKDKWELQLEEDDTIFISKNNNTDSSEMKEAILFMLRFFQKNKGNLTLTKEDREKFKEIVEMIK